MKKLIVLVTLLLLTITLTGCSKNDPLTGPSGTELVESDSLEFRKYNYQTKEEEVVYTFDFLEEYRYFKAINISAFEFTPINQYQEISFEMNRFLNEAVYLYDQQFEADYGDEITLSNGASDTDFNEIKLPVDDIVDIDAFFITEEGYSIAFLYTKLTTDGEIIIIPAAIYFFVHEIYTFDSCVTEGDTVEFETINSMVVPIMPKSSVNVAYDMYVDGNLQDIIDRDAMNCETTSTSLTGTISSSFSVSDVLLFYTENYGGQTIDGEFLFLHNGIEFVLGLNNDNDVLNYLISIKE